MLTAILITILVLIVLILAVTVTGFYFIIQMMEREIRRMNNSNGRLEAQTLDGADTTHNAEEK